jgi:hypothetical protein
MATVIQNRKSTAEGRISKTRIVIRRPWFAKHYLTDKTALVCKALPHRQKAIFIAAQKF